MAVEMQCDVSRKEIAGDAAEASLVLTQRWYFSRNEIKCHSPSRTDGIDYKHEEHLRKLYCSFLQELGIELKVPQLTIATAMMFCHRFYMRQSLAKNDWQKNNGIGGGYGGGGYGGGGGGGGGYGDCGGGYGGGGYDGNDGGNSYRGASGEFGGETPNFGGGDSFGNDNTDSGTAFGDAGGEVDGSYRDHDEPDDFAKRA